MYVDTQAYVASCDACQQNKASTVKPAGLLQPLPTPSRRWGNVSTDFITGLPRTASGFDAITVFVCMLTKMVRIAPTHTEATAEEYAQLLLDNVIRHHGVPSLILSDRGALYTSKVTEELYKRLRITRKLSTSFHPQTDGQTERLNRVLEDTLRHYVNATCDDWDKYLSCAEFAINSAVNASTGFAPFELAYGELPCTPLTMEVTKDHLTKGEEIADTLQRTVHTAKRLLDAAKARYKSYADRGRRVVTFSVGEHVLLSTKNLKLRVKHDTKLLPKYIGPLKVVSVVGAVAYKLELPPKWRVHPVFHVSLLKKYISRNAEGHVATPPVEWLDEEPLYEVEAIVDHHDASFRHKTVRKYLIKWKGYGHEFNSWERDSNLVNCAEALAEYWQKRNARTTVG